MKALGGLGCGQNCPSLQRHQAAWIARQRPGVRQSSAAFAFPHLLIVAQVYDLTAPLQISIDHTNENLILSWPANIVSHLQAQTNSAGLGTNWLDVPSASNIFVVPLESFNSSVFYRLKSP